MTLSRETDVVLRDGVHLRFGTAAPNLDMAHHMSVTLLADQADGPSLEGRMAVSLPVRQP